MTPARWRCRRRSNITSTRRSPVPAPDSAHRRRRPLGVRRRPGSMDGALRHTAAMSMNDIQGDRATRRIARRHEATGIRSSTTRPRRGRSPRKIDEHDAFVVVGPTRLPPIQQLIDAEDFLQFGTVMKIHHTTTAIGAAPPGLVRFHKINMVELPFSNSTHPMPCSMSMTFTKIGATSLEQSRRTDQSSSNHLFTGSPPPLESVSTLHVANGHRHDRTDELSGLPRRTEISADPLNEGPVPGNVSDDELLMIRARFLASRYDADHFADDLRRWRDAVDDADRYDEVVLWFEHRSVRPTELVQLLAQLDGTPPDQDQDHADLRQSVSRSPGLQGTWRVGALRPRQPCSRIGGPWTRRSSRWQSGRGRRIDRRTTRDRGSC